MSDPENSKPSQFISPKYWPMWCLFFLMWLVAKLPYTIQHTIGTQLGALLYRIGGSRRHIAETNIQRAFPELTEQEQNELVKKNFESTGLSVIEVGLSWWGNQLRLKKLLHIEGKENVEKALEQGRGVLLVGGHFTSMLMGGHLLTTAMPFYILVKKARNPLFEAMTNKYRERHYPGTIDSLDMRAMLRHLRRGDLCWYAPDQDFGPKQSVFAPFMGIECATLKTTAKLAKMAPVVPLYFERLPDKKGYRINLLPALENFPTDNELMDATTINKHLEEMVRKIPDQYLWVHRRFKTRPDGEKSFY